jgi:hypothetical protein
MEKFVVSNLDVSDISDSDLESRGFVERIREPGKYNLKIVNYKFGIKNKEDGAGKKWGWVSLTGECVESGKTITSIIDVPVETLTFTAPSGKTTKVKTQIFCNFLRSIGVENVSVSTVGEHVGNLAELLDAQPTMIATVDYRGDHVKYLG